MLCYDISVIMDIVDDPLPSATPRAHIFWKTMEISSTGPTNSLRAPEGLHGGRVR